MGESLTGSRNCLLAGHIGRTLKVIALAAAAPALLLILYLGYEQSNDRVEEFRRTTMNLAEAANVLQEQFAERTQQLLSTLDRLLENAAPDDIAAQERILKDFLATNPSYITFGLADRNGILVAGAKPVPPGVSVTGRRYWIQATRTMRFSAGEFVYSHTTLEPTFHFALPRKDASGAFSGMLIAAVKLTFPEHFITSLKLPEGGAFLLVDDKGVRLHRFPASDQFPEGKPIAANIMALADQGGPSGFFQTTGTDGQSRLYTYMRLKLDGAEIPYATLLLTVPLRTLEAKAHEAMVRNLGLLLAAMAAALALAHFLGKRALVLPATRLMGAARHLGDGDLHSRAEQGGYGGELGVLADTFNDMADRLLRRDDLQHKVEAALIESENKFRVVFEHTRELFGLLRPDGTLIKANPAALAAVGANLGAVLGKPFWETPWWDDDPAKQQRIIRAVEKARNGESVRFDTFHRGPEGQSIHVEFSLQPVVGENGEVILLVAEGRDVTERSVMETRLRHMALHDPLTGLANRTLLRDRIAQAMAFAKRNPADGFALLFIDLDRFKVVNDSLGHAVGDALLVSLSRRFQTVLREGDTLARYGGDEFVVLVPGIPTAREAIRVAKRLTRALDEPVAAGETRVRLSVSIGIELNPERTATPDELIRNANLAMHHAKQSRKKRPKAFTPRLLEDITAKRLMEQELPAALRNGQMHLAFQPIVDASDGGVPAGFEVLCRWSHPQRGAIPPGEFIRMAEDTGLIVDLGEWVLNEALAALARWTKVTDLARGIFVSVNVSPHQIDDINFSPMVRGALDRNGVAPSQLHLEITETAFMDASVPNVDRLRELAELGVGLSIDDFGTGYSNLALMTRLPVSDLKIDLSIVMAMTRNAGNLAVVRTIVSMARSMGLSVVAEGVETDHQRDLLLDLGCGLQQGFLHARPLTEDQALLLLAETDRAAPAA